jgi:phosphoserine phosphatase RsbU/P
MKILIADDDVTSRLILQSILQKWGFEALAMADGIEAWKLLQSPDAPLIALLDWEMPGIDGIELCRRVKALDRINPIHVIILTGRGSKEDTVLGLDSGADDYITKPFNDSELRARIRVAERLTRIQLNLTRKIAELADALEHVKTLQGIIPICMHCHKIRNDDEAWHRLEAYFEAHSEAQFSHSICPDCMKEHYPEFWPESK